MHRTVWANICTFLTFFDRWLVNMILMTLILNIEFQLECATHLYIKVNRLAQSFENPTIHYNVMHILDLYWALTSRYIPTLIHVVAIRFFVRDTSLNQHYYVWLKHWTILSISVGKLLTFRHLKTIVYATSKYIYFTSSIITTSLFNGIIFVILVIIWHSNHP